MHALFHHHQYMFWLISLIAIAGVTTILYILNSKYIGSTAVAGSLLFWSISFYTILNIMNYFDITVSNIIRLVALTTVIFGTYLIYVFEQLGSGCPQDSSFSALLSSIL